MADSEFTLAVAKFIYDRLMSESPMIAPVYDNVPQGTEPPFIEIGDATAAPYDNKSTNGQTVDIALEFVALHRGRKGVREMARAAAAVLHDVKHEPMSYGRIVHMKRAGYSDRRDDPATPRYRGTLVIIAIVDEG